MKFKIISRYTQIRADYLKEMEHFLSLDNDTIMIRFITETEDETKIYYDEICRQSQSVSKPLLVRSHEN